MPCMHSFFSYWCTEMQQGNNSPCTKKENSLMYLKLVLLSDPDIRVFQLQSWATELDHKFIMKHKISKTKMAVKIQIFFADLLLKNALHLKLTKIIRYHSYHEKHHFCCKKTHSLLWINLASILYKVKQFFHNPLKGTYSLPRAGYPWSVFMMALTQVNRRLGGKDVGPVNCLLTHLP